MDITYGDLLNATRGSDDSVAIVPSDAAAVSPPYRRIYVGGAGDVKVDTPNHVGVVYTAVPVGTYIYCRAIKVYAAGTTATNLVGEY